MVTTTLSNVTTTLSNVIEQFDSDEERYYKYWLDELVETGYILNYKYHVTIPIIEDKYIELQVLKGKKKTSKPHQFKLLNDITYEVDYLIQWNTSHFHDNDKFWFVKDCYVDKVANLLRRLHYAQRIDNQLLSYVDVKGTFAGRNNNSAIIFPIKQKLIYDKLGIYINSIKPLSDKGLFANTFTPAKYMKTDKTGKDRSIKWITKTLAEYVAK